jgi:hypothetical protein
VTLPRRRRPLFEEQQGTINEAMNSGSFRGRAPVVAPVTPRQRMEARARGITSVVSVTARSSKIDQFTLAANGAQDLTLTYMPILDSWNVDLNGFTAKNGIDYTITDQTLSLLTPLDARTADAVQVQYDYLTGTPTPALAPLALNIPYGSDGWKWKAAVGDASYYSTSLDDSAWSTGQGAIATHSFSGSTFTAPFTDPSSGVAGSTAGVHTDAGTEVGGGGLGITSNLWLRRWIGPGTGIVVHYDESNYADFYVNGVSAGSRSTGAHAAGSIGVADQAASWLLAVHVYGGNGQSWCGIDFEISGTEA